MHNILITADSRFPISRPKIKKALLSLLEEKRMTSQVEISVLVCGRTKSQALANKYLKDNRPHNVLSFPLEEKRLRNTGPKDDYILLGDIAVCYPLAQDEANRDNMRVDDKVNGLASHGLLHLLGENHG